MNDRLTGVAVFVHAVQAGSFAEAAGRLNLTRSAVAKAIARLEQRLGVRLFNRTTRRQSLTEDGQAYYERCVRALAELDAAEAALDSGRREPRGRLRVSAPVIFGRHCVAPVLRSLAMRHPGLELDLSFSDRVTDLVEEGFDLAVRIGPLADSASLAARRLGVQYMGIGAAPGYLAARGRPRTVAELDGHAAIAYLRGGRDVDWTLIDEQGASCRPRLDVRLRLDDLQAIADAAIAGVGLAWLPCWMLGRYMRSGELELVLDHSRSQPREIYAVWPHSHYLPSKTRAAIDALAAQIPAMLGEQPPFTPVLRGVQAQAA
ncbi:MAG TPA: LysR family transcriptional regulator [Burkholderiaceae bacterium]|nr:LysR family transcriptional regulator [Burkholderiaceae bacterium]